MSPAAGGRTGGLRDERRIEMKIQTPKPALRGSRLVDINGGRSVGAGANDDDRGPGLVDHHRGR
jgi:hypothetical protein